MIENLEVTPGDPSAKVVVNSRTGTVVISRNVRVTAAASPMARSRYVSLRRMRSARPILCHWRTNSRDPKHDAAIEEPVNPMFLFQPGVDLREIVDAVNQVEGDSIFPDRNIGGVKVCRLVESGVGGYLMNTGNLDTYFDFKGLGELKAQSNRARQR